MKARRRERPAYERATGARVSQAGAKLLVIEDEPDLQELLRYNLERQQFEVTGTDRGEQGLELARHGRPDLVLLDLMLPGMDGLEVCRALREETETAEIPILMLTARDQEMDIVRGLELGADDYVTKPYRWSELLARIRALLRRGGGGMQGRGGGDDKTIRVHGLEIDPARYRVTLDGALLELTVTEFKLLALLAGDPGRVFTRGQIIRAVHGELAVITERAVDVQVVALRRKLTTAAGDETEPLIETVRGIGYRFRE